MRSEVAHSHYDVIGRLYSKHRRSDPRIQAQIDAALGDARTVLDVGAGTGSYEATERNVVAVEPSRVMISQRPPGSAPTVRSVAESLPFASGTFDAVLAVLTVHHWRNPRLGLKEMARVGRRVVVLHFDPVVHNRFWLFSDYLPECNSLDTAQIFDHEELGREIGATRTEIVPIPGDCADGAWQRRHGHLLALESVDGGMRLVIRE